jgi:hypothetical protein
MNRKPTESDPSSTRAEVRGSPGVEARVSGILRLLWPLMIGGVAAGWLLRAAWPEPAVKPTLAAGLLLALAAFLGWRLWAGRQRLENFVKGARGEEEVARALCVLPPAFRVFHGVRLGEGLDGDSCDHLVCGPAGVTVIETKHWSGRIEISDGQILLNGQKPRRPPLDQVRATVTAVRRLLADKGLSTVPVQGLLCFAGNPLEKDSTGCGGVEVCNVRVLVARLRDSLESPLPPALVDQAAAIFEERVW